MQKYFRFLVLVFIGAWPAVSTAGGVLQAGVASGSMKGIVHDASGAVIPGVTVRARGLATGFERISQANESGQFELPVLPLGMYEVEVSAAGFATFRQSPIGVS